MNKIRIASDIQTTPSSLVKVLVVLLLFISSLFLLPVQLSQAYNTQIRNDDNLVKIKNFSDYNEKMSFIVGENNSLLASLELQEGEMDFPLTLSTITKLNLASFSLIVSNQTHYLQVWTNPLWKYPNGVSVSFSIRSTKEYVVRNIINEIKDQMYFTYLLNMSVFDINSHEGITYVSLVSFNMNKQTNLFDDIFIQKDNNSNGNVIGIMRNELLKQPLIYAYGFHVNIIHSHFVNLFRRIFLSLTHPIVNTDNGDYLLSLNDIIGKDIVPDVRSQYFLVNLRFPFIPNISYFYPNADNVAPKLSGVFEWVIKTPFRVHYSNFSFIIAYSTSTLDDIHYPRVIGSVSYSDELLNQEGILKMDYNIENIGSASAYNISLRTPVPIEFSYLLNSGKSIPVLKDNIIVNETVEANISLEVNIPYPYDIHKTDLFLKIDGWYQNSSTNELERWINVTSLNLYQNSLIIHSPQGLPYDLFLYLQYVVVPFMNNNFGTIFDVIQNKNKLSEQLAVALIYTYNSSYYAFYTMKKFFDFNASDFSYHVDHYGAYLSSSIAELKTDQNLTLSWNLFNIPTKFDKFGALLFSSESNGPDATIPSYSIFTTKSCDYWSMMIASFANTSINGRFLSSYDALNNSFSSTGSSFEYTDASGYRYYGITNGVNLQFGDDEAVLESTLLNSKDVYSIGDKLDFQLTIKNRGNIAAYSVHVDVVNVKLNYRWAPTNVILVKSFDIGTINASKTVSYNFQIRANSYLGLNTYVAIIHFISDKDQTGVTVVNPWTDESYYWPYAGETMESVSSTLTLGILNPPSNLQNKARPSFPVPEIKLTSNFTFSSDNSLVKIQYTIENVGLSSTNISILHLLNNHTFNDLIGISVSGIDLQYATFPYLSYVKIELLTNYQLSPSEKIIVIETFSLKSSDFMIQPLTIKYDSLYEIIATDFKTDSSSSSPYPSSPQALNVLNYKMIGTITDTNNNQDHQNKFEWIIYSSPIVVTTPIIFNNTNNGHNVTIAISSLPLIYPLITTAVSTVIIIVASIISSISRKRKIEKLIEEY